MVYGARDDTTPLLPSTRKGVGEAIGPDGGGRNHELGWEEEGEEDESWTSSVRRRMPSQTVLIPMATVLLVLVFVLTFYTRLYAAGAAMSATTNSQLPVPYEIQTLWGAYTPYFPLQRYQAPPHNCKVNQVNIIQRHGARYPTSGATSRILAAVNKLQSVPEFTDARLSFLKDYRYSLGVAEMVPFGAYQSAESGAVVYERYRKIVSKVNIPFVRASGSPRVIDAATNWTAGFAEASNNIYQPKLSVILNESLNDTLEDAMCPRAGGPDEQTAIWTDIFAPPIARRLNAWAPGANLTNANIPSLISLCAFESIAFEKLSPWCHLFPANEFAEYEYWSDVEKYYNRGHGQELGPVQGVGYINELLARLTNQPVHDNTQTNRTLTSSPLTFPLSRSIYADFSHDNLMVAVYSALGLFRQPAHLDPRVPDGRRTWVTSRLVPFSGRMVVERIECSGVRRRDVDERSGGDDGEEEEEVEGLATLGKETYVRILVNEAVQPLDFCGGDKHGLCTLKAFVKSQAYARNDGNGDFEKCFQEPA